MTTLEKQVNRVEHGFMTSECCKALTAAPSSKSCPQIYSSPGCPQQQIPILVSQQDQSFSQLGNLCRSIFHPELFQMLWYHHGGQTAGEWEAFRSTITARRKLKARSNSKFYFLFIHRFSSSSPLEQQESKSIQHPTSTKMN